MKTGKERQKKYRLKKISEGKKPVTVFLSEKAYSFLKNGPSQNYSEAIDKALIFYQTSTVTKTKKNGLVMLDKQTSQIESETPETNKKRRLWFGKKRKDKK
ncbi:hypothetical protein MHK_003721 [Candidatus Magnetomorum sp. HK-1]|nr:hypothetical protein MHK_003721 [Candidatus Magnetomorum sp. HK-1]